MRKKCFLKIGKNKTHPNHFSQRKENKGAKHTYFLLWCQIPADFQIHSLTVSIQRITETMSEIPSPMDCSYTFKCGDLTIWTLKPSTCYTLELNFYTSEALDDAAECIIISVSQTAEYKCWKFFAFKFTELHHILGQKNPRNSPLNQKSCIIFFF